MKTHQYIQYAFYDLCATYEVIFNDLDYDNIIVVGMEKPQWNVVLAKCEELELIVVKTSTTEEVKKTAEEARFLISGSAIASHWSNQYAVATRILTDTASEEEIDATNQEIELRGADETLEEFANLVLSKANANFLLQSKISGGLKKCIKDISLSEDKEEVNAAFLAFKDIIS